MSTGKIDIAFDVGYASIGWAASETTESGLPIFRGTGSVVFEADRCLASERRKFRRQRRNIRATRQRISRLKRFLLSRGVIDAESFAKRHLDPCPWQLSAEVIRNGRILSAEELLSVLLWYAHNRGYDGNRLWSSRLRASTETDQADTEKVESAKKAMTMYGKTTMAETVAGIVTDGKIGGPALVDYKSMQMAFPRECVADEVKTILNFHIGKINGLTADVVEAIIADPVIAPNALRNFPEIPKAYVGGFLFGQTAPRFDNRIVTICPVSKKKTPNKTCDAFLRFRWAELLSNVRVSDGIGPMRGLAPDEMKTLNDHVVKYGRYTAGEFKRDVRAVAHSNVSNLDALLSIPDADSSLMRYPGLAALDVIGIDEFKDDEETRQQLRRISHALFKGKVVRGETLRPLLKQGFSGILKETYSAKMQEGRAPFSAEVMKQAADAIFKGQDPHKKGGVLYRDCVLEDPVSLNDVDHVTNNHLVRHRLKILVRLLNDIIVDYAENNPDRVEKIFVEVARDIKDFSGKKQKAIQTELNRVFKSHQEAVKKAASELGIDELEVTAGLARKIRIAKDLGFTCPYTGHKFDLEDIKSRIVDLDHVLPRSQRQTDSMDSLVLTFKAVNERKGARTALQFIKDCGGSEVVDIPLANNAVRHLEIMPEARYRRFVESLRPAEGLTRQERDVFNRRKRRLMTLHTAAESEMTAGMLTQTSAITKLAMRVISGYFKTRGCRLPPIVTIPGRVTKEVRSKYSLHSVLAEFDCRLTRTFETTDENGKKVLKSKVIPKGEMRNLTHMHHAVDAIALILAGTLIKPDAMVWSLMGKRHLADYEQAMLKSAGPFIFTKDGEPRLMDLDKVISKSIRAVLGELRTVRNNSKRIGRTVLEETQWRVEKCENGRVSIRQGKKTDNLAESAVYGLCPEGGRGKLKELKSVFVGDANFAIALCKEPVVIRERFVWRQLNEAAKANDGKSVSLLRKGDLVLIDGETWIVKSIKDNKGKILLDLTVPYNAAAVQNGVPYCKINVMLKSLLKRGSVKKLRYSLTGVSSCPITQLKSPGREKVK